MRGGREGEEGEGERHFHAVPAGLGGEGRVNPPLTASSKEEIPWFSCIRPSIRPSLPAALHLPPGCLRPGTGSACRGCFWGQRSLTAPAAGASLHPSLHPLSFRAAVIYSPTISLPSSSLHPSLSPPPPTPHHAPIIFRALS